MRLVRKMAVASLIAIAPAIGVAGMAGATPSPNGGGQPGTGGAGLTSCQIYMTTPGNSASAESPFNPDGNAGMHYAGNPGTKSALHTNSTHAIAEYDIACFQQTVHGH